MGARMNECATIKVALASQGFDVVRVSPKRPSGVEVALRSESAGKTQADAESAANLLVVDNA